MSLAQNLKNAQRPSKPRGGGLMQALEASAADQRQDRGMKENSPRDRKADAMALKRRKR